jgi:hypothetical protein
MKETQIGGMDLTITGQANALVLPRRWYQRPSVKISGSPAFSRLNGRAPSGLGPRHPTSKLAGLVHFVARQRQGLAFQREILSNVMPFAPS